MGESSDKWSVLCAEQPRIRIPPGGAREEVGGERGERGERCVTTLIGGTVALPTTFSEQSSNRSQLVSLKRVVVVGATVLQSPRS